MKICLDLQPIHGKRSGVGIYTYELAKRLKNTENISFEGTVFNFLNRNESPLQELSFDVKVNKIMPYGIYRRFPAPLSFNSMFNSHADIFHFFNFTVPPKIKGHVITTIYDLAFKRYPETLQPQNLKRIEKSIDYSIKRSTKIITISEFTKTELINFYDVEENKIEIIYPAPDLGEKSENFNNISSIYKISKPYFLYIGTLEPRKNLGNLITAFNKFLSVFEDFQLVIAGKKGWGYDNIFETVHNYNLKERVVFTDYIDDPTKKTLYENAFAFVYPSLYEGFGMPIIEAMSLGVPVICSDTSAMSEITNSSALLIDPFDPDSIANAMTTLISDETMYNNLRRKGIKNSSLYDWDKSKDKLMELYKSISY